MDSDKRIRRQKPPIAVELFAGVGGLSLGLERAGFDLAAAIELDSNHAAVHRFNFPRTALIQADIESVSARRIRDAVERGLTAHGRDEKRPTPIDLLAGGPPCQGFSDGGTHDPADQRNRLVFEFARVVRELQPRFFLMENVPGLLRPKHADRWSRLVNDLKSAGYEVASPLVLDASDFGVPQGRSRLFLFGSRLGEPTICEPTRLDRCVKVRDAFRALPDASLYPELYEADVLPLDRLDARTRSRLAEPRGDYARLMREQSPKRGFRRPWSKVAISGMALTAHAKKVLKRFAATAAGEREPVSRYARLDPGGLCPTLRSGTGPDHGSHTPPRPIHPSGARVITVREAARLHSFPDWFAFHATKWHAWRGIGNAVPPLLACAVAEKVAEHTDATDEIRGTLPWGDPRKLGFAEAW